MTGGLDLDFIERATFLVELFKKSFGRIVIFTGAGISTSANIPDYRGTHGLWRRHELASRSTDCAEVEVTIMKKESIPNSPPVSSPERKRMPAIQHAIDAPEFINVVKKRKLDEDYKPVEIKRKKKEIPKLRLPEATFAQPTYTHMAISKLIQEGYVRHVVSQNVDGLHLRSGLERHKLSELHGNLFIEQCQACSHTVFRKFDVAETTARSRHYTGRLCPRCCENMPHETGVLRQTITQTVSQCSRDVRSRLRAYRRAAHMAVRSARLNQHPNGLPLLQDVIVHYFERQPEQGLAEIYRIQTAMQAIHGAACMKLVQTEPLCAAWGVRLRRAMQNARYDESAVSLEDLPAKLILVLGTSLVVLRNYSFLWPSGLGRCRRVEKKRNEDAECSPNSSSSSQTSGVEKRQLDEQRCALVINSIQPTCKDGIANLVFREKCDELMRYVMEQGLGIQVPQYDQALHDQILSWATPLPPEEQGTRTRQDLSDNRAQ